MNRQLVLALALALTNNVTALALALTNTTTTTTANRTNLLYAEDLSYTEDTIMAGCRSSAISTN